MHLSAREWQALLVGVASVFRHLVVGGLLVALDFLVFWVLDQVQQQVKGDVAARGNDVRMTAMWPQGRFSPLTVRPMPQLRFWCW